MKNEYIISDYTLNKPQINVVLGGKGKFEAVYEMSEGGLITLYDNSMEGLFEKINERELMEDSYLLGIFVNGIPTEVSYRKKVEIELS